MDDGQENCLLAFEEGGDLEDRLIFEVFLTIVLWEDESKVLLGPKIFFDGLEDKIEVRWLDPVFKVPEDLVGGLNADSRSSLRWLRNLEED